MTRLGTAIFGLSDLLARIIGWNKVARLYRIRRDLHANCRLAKTTPTVTSSFALK
jgi:hypothetical protein